ncbi:hypothetical protein PAT3040_05256, partial [Paenibacillus agaridevorans]
GEGAGDPRAYSYAHTARSWRIHSGKSDELSGQIEETSVMLKEQVENLT